MQTPVTASDPSSAELVIRTRPQSACMACGGEGRGLYSGLKDRLFDTAGSWSHSQCSNPDCGMIWLDPMPVEEDIYKAYASYYTHSQPEKITGWLARQFLESVKRGYLANHFGYIDGVGILKRFLGLLPWLYPGRSAELDFSVMWLEARDRGRVLDIGAGSGWLVENLGQLGWQAEGLDFDSISVNSARNRGLVFHQGDLKQQLFSTGSFDAVTMSHCLEHLHDPLSWLIEVRRVIRPGGRLVLVTPNTRSYLHQEFGEHWFGLQPPTHLHLFNRASLTQLLQRAGFDQPNVFTSIRDANGYFIGSRAIRNSGRYDMSKSRGLITKLQGRAMQLVQGLTKQFDADAGEDLVVLAVRT